MSCSYIAVCQNLVPLVNIKIAGKWMFIPLKMVLIGIDPYPYDLINGYESKPWCPDGTLSHSWYSWMLIPPVSPVTW